MSQSSKPLIIVTEDDRDLAALITTQLETADMDVQVCYEAAHAFRFLKNNFANLLLLDVHLPDDTGFHLIDDLRQNGIDIPVIFLTAEKAEDNKVKALELGGDDYITKPFSFAELIARIHAVLRRANTSHDTNVTKNAATTDVPFDFAGAEINPQRIEIAFPDGEVVKIGRKELGIITYLSNNTNSVITRKDLIHSVWGVHADVRSRSLDQYIVKIRDLFKQHGISLDTFRTVHGVGYIYETLKSA
jgi:DNA-binding response OmpR family regulator|tara:strand:+ start:350 stop:1087 length:738 start_codon:yes stop_codon:yes gene_type:complete